jgi:hypothetical protein
VGSTARGSIFHQEADVCLVHNVRIGSEALPASPCTKTPAVPFLENIGKNIWPGKRKWHMGRSAPARYYLRDQKRKITMARTCRRNVRRKICEECFYKFDVHGTVHRDIFLQ